MNARDELRDGALPRSRYVLFFTITILGCALDLLTKQWVFSWLGPPQRDNEWWLWEPYIGIETSVNPGALFGMGSGWGRLFALLSIAAGIGIPVWLFVYGAARSLWITVALSSIMAGVLGNLYDRLGMWTEPGMPKEWSSAVRDWILLQYRGHKWPNFNIADSMLVTGAIMLLWHTYWDKPNQEPAASEQ